MSEATAVQAETEILEAGFIKEMVRQLRALDSYGTCDDWPAERLLAPLMLTPERKREIPVVGDPDEITLSRVQAFYNAVSVQIEKESGLMAVPIVNLSHEGFGRALITVGKLVVLDRPLRDVHRFGFPSLGKLKDEGDKYLSAALDIIGKHSDVAGF